MAALVEDKQYDRAILKLVEIGRQSPEQIEKIQKRIQRIQKFKNDNLVLFEELSKAVGEVDGEKAARIIAQIKENSPYLNRMDKNRIILALSIIGKAVDDKIRDEYFQRAEGYLAEGQFPEAINVYREGYSSQRYFDLTTYRDYVDFFAPNRAAIEKYAKDTERQSLIWDVYAAVGPEGDKVVEGLSPILNEWEQSAGELNRSVQALLNLLESEKPALWNSAVTGTVENLEVLDGYSRELQEQSVQLKSIQNKLYKGLQNAPEEFYYERIGEFLNGRAGSEGREGIFYAQEELQKSTYQRLIVRMGEVLETLVASLRTDYSEAKWESALAEAASAEGAIDELLSFAEQAERYIEADNEWTAYARITREALPVWTGLIALERSLPQLELPDAAVLDLARIDSLAEPLRGNIRKVLELRNNWQNTEASLPKPSAESSRALVAAVRSDLQQAVDVYQDSRLRLYLSALAPLYERTRLQAEAALAVDLRALEEYANQPPERHPSRALAEQIDPAVNEVDASAAVVEDFIDVARQMLSRRPPVANPEQVDNYRIKGEALLGNLTGFRGELEKTAREARRFEAAARRGLSKGNNALIETRRNLDSAREATRRGEKTNRIDAFYQAVDFYKAAEDSLAQAELFYGEIRTNDVDIARESGLLAELTALRNQADTERANVTVTVKRNALSEARAAYSSQNYPEAIAVLNQAQNFWERTYGETDSEIAAWRTRLNNAQQALSQTVIEPGDPLFSEMNQYLNLANRYYSEGKRKAQAGRAADALRSFRSAEDLLEQVLVVFPGNEAALLLKQRILRETDYEAWSVGARNLVRSVRSALVRKDRQAFLGQGGKKGLYADLLVLRKIDPEFAGLSQSVNYSRGLIYDVEVLIGRIQPPPDPQAIARSRQYTSRARQIWDAVGTEGSAQALELLDRALAEWLENTEASRLRDEITARKTTRIIPAKLQERLIYFDQFFAQGDYFTAKLIIDQIRENYPAFANDPRIIRRLRDVEARQ